MYTKKTGHNGTKTACRKYMKMQFDYSLSFFCVTKVDMKPKQRIALTNATRN